MAATETNGRATTDIDAEETRDWLESLDSVLRNDGADRARFLLERLVAQAGRVGASPPLGGTTPYVNTIPVDQEPEYPGDEAVERRIRTLIRWNAMATVLQANKESSELGGHIASYQSAATLYEVGFNHFWHAPSEDHGGDLVFMQGHCAPGFYARAFLEGRVSEDQLRRFRQEIGENGGFDGDGISSYPHPWLMPDFWQFPTVSMGLGPIMAIYQARFMKYLHGREIADTEGRKVWGFLGDGETDEPESLGAISMAGREKLDNLIFVVNCNLQRLDGPVRGNGKIIQELETVFRGAGWNVIKVVWGSRWDELLARDTEGRLLARMEEAVDGEYQTFKARDGAYVREYFFGKDPKLLEMVVGHVRRRDLGAQPRRPRPAQDPRRLRGRGRAHRPADGDPRQDDQGLRDGRGRRGPEHHPPAEEDDRERAARVPRSLRASTSPTSRSTTAASTGRPTDSPEMTYLRERLDALGGGLPVRRAKSEALEVPGALGLRRAAAGQRRARELHHDGVRPHPQHAAARQADRPPRRPDRARRVAHVRHGGHVPAVRDLQPAGPALPARGLRPADVLQGGQEGPDPPGGHQRAGRVLRLDRRRARRTPTTTCR